MIQAGYGRRELNASPRSNALAEHECPQRLADFFWRRQLGRRISYILPTPANNNLTLRFWEPPINNGEITVKSTTSG
jgi:hypothetical protein